MQTDLSFTDLGYLHEVAKHEAVVCPTALNKSASSETPQKLLGLGLIEWCKRESSWPESPEWGIVTLTEAGKAVVANSRPN